MAETLDDSIVPDVDRYHPSSYMDSRNHLNLTYDVEDLPGRGKGVIARRTIPQWSVVMAGWPAIVLPMEYQRYFSLHQRRALLGRAVRQLPKEQQTTILSLARSTGGELIEDILKTNIFGIELDGVPHMGLFPGGSRVNHNCKPNTYWRYSPQTMTMEVVALRDILAGEEVTHSYVPLGKSAEERQLVVREWGFNCTCWMCTSSPAQKKESDDRRQRIQDIHASLAESYEGDSEYGLDEESVAELAEELFSLIETEELQPQLVVYYEVVARAYMEIGEWDSAREYIALTEKQWIKFGGVEHDNIEGIKELWTELKQRVSGKY
ncbi:SET domain-containing protein [Thozetella sp. PMI_491]|nr:SET domain-containing protein [Thozetella sp. PMI_491]